MKFKKLVAVDNIGFPNEDQYKRLDDFADEVVIYTDFPKSDDEIIKRIGDADCLLVSWNTKIGANILSACKNLKYVGMCCSLYDEKSANVDIAYAREHEIQVLGIRDYGDQGVVEYLISELIEVIHGFDKYQWKDHPVEITGLKFGVIGMGVTGTMVAQAVKFFGGEVYYNDLRRNEKAEAEGIKYLELEELLKTVDVISTHLPKHLRLLNDKNLEIFGNGKMVINTSIGPTYELDAMKKWLSNKSNFLLSEKSSMTDWLPELSPFDNFVYTDKVCGMTLQAKVRLVDKVLNNMTSFLNK